MGAAPRIRSVISCARRIFLSRPTTAQIEELKHQINELSLSDVENLVDIPLLTKPPHPGSDSLATFVDLYEDATFSLGLIALQPKARLPLHDHPEMTGFIKVISGRLRVRSFTALPAQGASTLAKLESDSIISANGDIGAASSNSQKKADVISLEPGIANLHQIDTVDTHVGGSFFDLLAPPYSVEDGRRPCHYYQVRPLLRQPENVKDMDKQLFALRKIEEPPFACASFSLRHVFQSSK